METVMERTIELGTQMICIKQVLNLGVHDMTSPKEHCPQQQNKTRSTEVVAKTIISTRKQLWYYQQVQQLTI